MKSVNLPGSFVLLSIILSIRGDASLSTISPSIAEITISSPSSNLNAVKICQGFSPISLPLPSAILSAFTKPSFGLYTISLFFKYIPNIFSSNNQNHWFRYLLNHKPKESTTSVSPWEKRGDHESFWEKASPKRKGCTLS